MNTISIGNINQSIIVTDQTHIMLLRNRFQFVWSLDTCLVSNSLFMYRIVRNIIVTRTKAFAVFLRIIIVN